MSTNILCAGAGGAIFTASHLGLSKEFNSKSVPLTRSDWQYDIANDRVLDQGGSTILPEDGIKPLFDIPPTGLYRLSTAGTFYGTTVEFFAGSTSLGIFGSLQLDALVDAESPLLPNGVPFGIRYIAGEIPRPSPLPRRPSAYGTFTVRRYNRLWGHRVTDKAGVTEMFASGVITRPAPYSVLCSNQCPPGQTRCGSCCLDCADTARQIAALGAKL
jgi:hypothetical protein